MKQRKWNVIFAIHFLMIQSSGGVNLPVCMSAAQCGRHTDRQSDRNGAVWSPTIEISFIAWQFPPYLVDPWPHPFFEASANYFNYSCLRPLHSRLENYKVLWIKTSIRKRSTMASICMRPMRLEVAIVIVSGVDVSNAQRNQIWRLWPLKPQQCLEDP